MWRAAGGTRTARILEGAGTVSTAIDIRAAVAADLDVAQGWLADADLPTGDLTPSHMDAFLIATRGDVAVGMIGIESFGDVGLLRSLVVDATCRGLGLGRQLVDALEATARDQGIGELWLLTIDADAFFTRLGYATVDRDNAPSAIRNTQEFATLCPGDAVLMRKGI